MPPNDHGNSPDKNVTIDFDDEPLVVPRDTTPNEIMNLAELDPAEHYLVHVQGNKQESFKDRGDEPQKVHNNDKWVSVYTGPTTTS